MKLTNEYQFLPRLDLYAKTYKGHIKTKTITGKCRIMNVKSFNLLKCAG